MEFVVATNNKKKLAEISRILKAEGHTAQSLAEIGLDIDPDETGTTFAENALIKAQAVCAACGRPTIADDSGLVVDALDGAPGVYSARYAGAGHDDAANNQKLLQELAGMPLSVRTARFVSAIAVVLPDGGLMQAEGSCEGVIGTKATGTGGFGYDPLFYVDGLSYAEMDAATKDAISHRGRALAAMQQQLGGFLAAHGYAG